VLALGAVLAGAVVGAEVAGALLVLGDVAAPLQAAKMTVNDAANATPLIDHLFGV
jgi:hypothetical protein